MFSAFAKSFSHSQMIAGCTPYTEVRDTSAHRLATLATPVFAPADPRLSISKGVITLSEFFARRKRLRPSETPALHS